MYASFRKGNNQPWGEVGLMRWSFSLFCCTRHYSWKVPVRSSYSCLCKCSLLCILTSLSTTRGFNQFISSPSSQHSLLGIIFLRQYFPRCFTRRFQLKVLSLHHPLLILVTVLNQLLCLFSEAGISVGLQEQEEQYLQEALGGVGALLLAVLNIWMKKLLCDWFVFSLIHPICNMKSSISLWKVLNLFLPFILILYCIIFRSWLSTVNYFLSALLKQRFARPFSNHIYW